MTFLDTRLATLHGLEQSEPGFVRVALGDSPRRGILIHAAPPPGVDVPIDVDATSKREPGRGPSR